MRTIFYRDAPSATRSIATLMLTVWPSVCLQRWGRLPWS